jgi:hypothetical protein
LVAAATAFCSLWHANFEADRSFAIMVNELLTFSAQGKSNEHCAVRCSIAAWENPPAAPVHGRMSRQFEKPAHKHLAQKGLKGFVMLQPIATRQFPSAFAQNAPAYAHASATTALPQKTGEHVITVEVDAVLANATKLSAMLIDADTAPGNSLAKLALVFASAAHFERAKGESLHDFGLRLASFIDAMKPQDLALAERLSGLRLLGISAKSLAEALRNPSSVVAARIIAQAEFPGLKDGNGVAQTVIDTYQENETAEQLQPLPARATAPADRPASTSSASAPLQMPVPDEGIALAEDAAQPLQPSKASASTVRPEPATTLSTLMTEQEALLQPALQLTTTLAEIISEASAGQHREISAEAEAETTPSGKALAAETQETDIARADSRFLDRRMERFQDRRMQTMRVLRGFSEVVSVLDRKDAAQVKALVGSMLPTPAEALRFLPTLDGTELTRAFKALATVDLQTAQTRDENPAPVAMADADPVTVMSEEADAEGVYDRADPQSAAKMNAASDSVAARTREMPVLRHGEAVPAYMLAYPIADGPKAEKSRVKPRNAHAASQEDDETDEEARQNRQQDNKARDDGFEAADGNDKPFEPETKLNRRPTDAERAFHMYQNMGGF